MNTFVKQTESDNKLAHNLDYLLKRRGITDNEIAQALGFPLMTIRRIVSGETADPRISTLKLIADYLNVSIDLLIETPNTTNLNLAQKNKPLFVPVLDWATAENITSFKDIELTFWPEWQPIHYPTNEIHPDAFALKSLPSMYPKFPKGTLFILSPHLKPSDGDMVLIRLRQNKEIALKELMLDPPEKKLASLVDASHVIDFKEENYAVLGVVVLTLLFPKRNT